MSAARRVRVRRVALSALLGLVVYYAVGTVLMAPSQHVDRLPPASMRAEPVVISSASGARLAAWLFVPDSPRAAAVVLHGVHADRAAMIDRADLLVKAGFAVLLPDLQAHGESTGEHITFGFLEARDAEASVAFVRRRFSTLPVVGIGVSLGGAAFTLAGDRAPVDALVLEAVFPSVEEALDNRLAMRIGPLSRLVTPLLLLQLRPRLGVSPSELRPVDAIRRVGCPLFIVSGTADRHTTAAQTRALFAAAPDPKQLWLVPGAAHVDLLRYDPPAYKAHVLGFIEAQVSVRREAGATKPRSPV